MYERNGRTDFTAMVDGVHPGKTEFGRIKEYSKIPMVAFLILFFLVLPSTFQPRFIRIGIIPSKMEEEEYKIVESIFERSLLKEGFIVLTRDELKHVLEEKKAISYGLFENEKEIGKVGKLLGLDVLMVLSDFSRFGYGEGVIVKVLNVKSGQILYVGRKNVDSTYIDDEIEEFAYSVSKRLSEILCVNNCDVNMKSLIVRKVSSSLAGPVRYEIDVLKHGYLCVFVRRNGYFELLFSKYVVPSKVDIVLNIDKVSDILFLLSQEIPEKIIDHDEFFERFERGAYICEKPF